MEPLPLGYPGVEVADHPDVGVVADGIRSAPWRTPSCKEEGAEDLDEHARVRDRARSPSAPPRKKAWTQASEFHDDAEVKAILAFLGFPLRRPLRFFKAKFLN